jgi:anti-anti-sigma factor
VNAVSSIAGGTETGPCVLRVDGDFDAVSLPHVRDALNTALEEGYASVVLDLSNVDYMDSSALGFIVWADQRLGPVHGRLALVGANPDVARILELSGLIGVAPSVVVSPSMEDALSSHHLVARVDAPLWAESLELPSH